MRNYKGEQDLNKALPGFLINGPSCQRFDGYYSHALLANSSRLRFPLSLMRMASLKSIM